MKITKDYLKKLIKEEIAAMDDGNANDGEQKGEVGDDEVTVGDFLEISISDDGYDKSIEKVEKEDYENTKSFYASFKALVKIEQIAKTER